MQCILVIKYNGLKYIYIINVFQGGVNICEQHTHPSFGNRNLWGRTHSREREAGIIVSVRGGNRYTAKEMEATG